jgi:hypothetical protein
MGSVVMSKPVHALIDDMITLYKGTGVAKRLGYHSSMGFNILAIYGLTTPSDNNLGYYDFHRFNNYSKLEIKIRTTSYLLEVEKEYKSLIEKHNINLDLYMFAHAFLNCNLKLKKFAIREGIEFSFKRNILASDFAEILASGFDSDKAIKLYAIGCKVQDFDRMKDVPLEWASSLVNN